MPNSRRLNRPGNRPNAQTPERPNVQTSKRPNAPPPHRRSRHPAGDAEPLVAPAHGPASRSTSAAAGAPTPATAPAGAPTSAPAGAPAAAKAASAAAAPPAATVASVIPAVAEAGVGLALAGAGLALDGVAGLFGWGKWLVCTSLPGGLLLVLIVVIGPAEAVWMPGVLTAWLLDQALADGTGWLLVRGGAVLAVVAATYYFQMDEYPLSPGEAFLPAVKGAAVAAVVIYSLPGFIFYDVWPVMVALCVGAHWITVRLAEVFDL